MLALLLLVAPPSLEDQLRREGPAALATAARKSGDPIRGAELFHRPQLSCTKCHTAGEPVGRSPLGPDLARPEPNTTAALLAEAVLDPSKVIRKGYEAVTVVRTDGGSVTGLVAEERADALVLRDPAAGGQPVTIPKADIESRKPSAASLMPSGLVNQLPDRQAFLDLLAFLTEAAEFGPARARALRPDPSVIDPPLPSYESDLDHAGFIAGLDAAAFQRGEALYARVCASCHGTREAAGSMPTSLRFWDGKFKNGSDPHSLYRTLTRGAGLMPPQSQLVPREKYDVIHYVREAFVKPHNPTQYVASDLASLPKGTSRGPAPPAVAPWRAMDYGPALGLTVEVSPGNIAYKGIAVRLDAGPGGVAAGKAWAVYDHDTMRLAGAWTGDGFIDWNGINFNGRHEVHPKVAGTVHVETASGPGWADPATGSFADPRPLGRDGKPYGPLPATWLKYRGLQHVGDRVVLSYTVGDTPVQESIGLVGHDATRAFEVGPRQKPLALRISKAGDGKWAGAHGLNRPNFRVEDGHRILHLPAGEERLTFDVWTSQPGSRLSTPLTVPKPAQGDLLVLPQPLATTLERGPDAGPFAVDTLALPEKNPWAAQLRLTGLDFLPNGDLAVCTWDGDVWRVSGLADNRLTWKRLTTGLFQPLGLKVVDGVIYVGCRDQIAVVREDGRVECFNSDHQVTESFHEFAMGLQTDAAGNFLYAKGAPHGKRAWVPQHGTLLRVSKDGRSTEILATGFRAPNGVCVNPDGTFFVTDQEGFWLPKNRINWVRPGRRFFGNVWAYSNVTDPADAAQEEPVCWITNRFDRSPGEMLRVDSKSWGGLNGAYLNLSYGTGNVFVVPHETVGDAMHGGMVRLPIPTFPTGVMRGRFGPDGHLYVCGMYAWAGNRQQPGGLYRIRATGKPMTLPVGYHVAADGLALTFSDPLHPDAARDVADFGLKVWDLHRSEKYGSPHLNERPLRVTAAGLSADRRTLSLTVPELRPTRGLELWYAVRAADGTPVDGLLHGSVRRP